MKHTMSSRAKAAATAISFPAGGSCGGRPRSQAAARFPLLHVERKTHSLTVQKDVVAPLNSRHPLLSTTGGAWRFWPPRRAAPLCSGGWPKSPLPRTKNGRCPRVLLQVAPPRIMGVLVIALLVCGVSPAKDADDSKSKTTGSGGAAQKQVGTASWYGPGFQGKETASGETFKQNAMTAASQDLPLGSKAAVTNLNNGKKVVVKINDRGPYVDGRVIDLSRGAAEKLGMVEGGTAKVKVVAKKPSNGSDKEAPKGGGSSSHHSGNQ
jgi:rare lipoprotein A